MRWKTSESIHSTELLILFYFLATYSIAHNNKIDFKLNWVELNWQLRLSELLS